MPTAKWMTLGFYVLIVGESPAMEKTVLIGKERKRLGLIKELVFSSCRTGLTGHSCQLLLALSGLDHCYVFVTAVKGRPREIKPLAYIRVGSLWTNGRMRTDLLGPCLMA